MSLYFQEEQPATENVRAVSIGEIVVSDAPRDILVAYGLGSCVGICAYDPMTRVGGILHALLPASPTSGEAKGNPAKFVDRGVPLLIGCLEKLGARRNRLVIHLGGGAQMLTMPGFNNSLNIGSRNVLAAQAILKATGLRIRAEATGGHAGRTIKLYIANGQVTVKTLGQGEQPLS